MQPRSAMLLNHILCSRILIIFNVVLLCLDFFKLVYRRRCSFVNVGSFDGNYRFLSQATDETFRVWRYGTSATHCLIAGSEARCKFRLLIDFVSSLVFGVGNFIFKYRLLFAFSSVIWNKRRTCD